MQLQKKPFPIDFLGNDPEFVIRTSPDVVEGRKYHRIYNVSSLTAGTLCISTPYGVLNMEVTGSASDFRADQIKTAGTAQLAYEQLVLKVVYNHFLNTHYKVSSSYSSGVCTLSFQAIEPLTGDNVSVTSSGNASEITVSQYVSRGLSRLPKENYSILTCFELGDGTRTGELVYQESNGTVSVGTEHLSAYLHSPDIPRLGESFGAVECQGQILTARMLFSECISGTPGLVMVSPDIRLINACVSREDFLNNRGDWSSADNRKLWLKNDVDIHGQDNAATVETDTDTEQYLYIANLTGSSVSKLCTVSVVGSEGSGSANQSMTFPPFSISRISCGYPAFQSLLNTNVGTPLRWTVSIPLSGGQITRSFICRPRPYKAVTLLLQNRCRLYESMVFETTADEMSTTGEQVFQKSGMRHVIEKSTRSVILRSGKRNSSSIALLRDAVSMPHNLLVDGKYAWRITVEPSSITTSDTGEDLIEVEIKVLKTERIDRDAAIIPVVQDPEILERETIIK